MSTRFDMLISILEGTGYIIADNSEYSTDELASYLDKWITLCDEYEKNCSKIDGTKRKAFPVEIIKIAQLEEIEGDNGYYGGTNPYYRRPRVINTFVLYNATKYTHEQLLDKLDLSININEIIENESDD